jgi:hypothetical protein
MLSQLPNGLRAPMPSVVRRNKSVWQILSAAKVLVATSGLPGTWPAETVNGFVASNGITTTRWFATRECTFSRAPGELDTYPPVLQRELAPLLRDPNGIRREEVTPFFTLKEDEYRMIYDEPLGSVFQHTNPLKEFAITYQADLTHLDIAHYLLKTYRPRVLGTYIELLAALQPVYWIYTYPETFGISPEDARRAGGAVDAGYRFVDAELGRLLAEMTDHSTLIVVGGYGFTTGTRIGSDGTTPVPVPEPSADAALILYGQGIRNGVRLTSAMLTDVTPTLLALTGCATASDMDGRVLQDALTPEFLAVNTPRVIQSHDAQWDQSRRFGRPLDAFESEPGSAAAGAGPGAPPGR